MRTVAVASRREIACAIASPDSECESSWSMSNSLRSASNASAAVFPDKKNCWLFSIFGVNMATPPKIPMFHAFFNSSRLIWEKIFLRLFQNSAMRGRRQRREQSKSGSERWGKPSKRATPGAGRNRASSNSAAENAARGPHCSVFLPGWQKTRPWGLSRCSGVAEKARKGAAKREKRQESRRRGPECHAGPMQRGPMAAFPAILRPKPRNRSFPAKNLLNATSI